MTTVNGSTTVPDAPTSEVATPISAREGVDSAPTHRSATCWCQPKVAYVDPITGDRVYVHRRLADGVS